MSGFQVLHVDSDVSNGREVVLFASESESVIGLRVDPAAGTVDIEYAAFIARVRPCERTRQCLRTAAEIGVVSKDGRHFRFVPAPAAVGWRCAG